MREWKKGVISLIVLFVAIVGIYLGTALMAQAGPFAS